MKRARRYEVYLPRQYNDGRPVEAVKLLAIYDTLLKRFAGITQFPVALPSSEGAWLEAGISFTDPLSIYVICVPATQSNRTFFQGYKETLKRALRQEEIFITEQSINIR